MRSLTGLVLVCATVGISACGTYVPPPTPFPAIPVQYDENSAKEAAAIRKGTVSTTIVMPGNLLSVKSDLDPKVTASVRVPWDGIVVLPYDIDVKVGGLTLLDARRAIEEAYQPIIRGTSHIKLRLDAQKIMARARGLVAKPGDYIVERGGSVDELVAAAGGLVRPAEGVSLPSVATISTPSGKRMSARLDDYYSGQAEEMPVLFGGETVLFHDGATSQSNSLGVTPGRVRFLGQVKHPGEFPVRDNAHLMYYFVQAGGPTDRADLSGVRVWRISDGEIYNYRLSARESDPKFELAAGDLVFIPADVRTDLERASTVVGGVGSFIGSLAATAIVAK